MSTKPNQQLTFLLIILFVIVACQPEKQDLGLHVDVSLRYPNGKSKIHSYSYVEDSSTQTHFTSFYPNGKVRETYNLKNGLKYGAYQAFHYDGQTKEYCIYEDGLENGEYISYYPNRRYLSRINWKEGILHGKSTYFYPNGQPLQTGQFVDGLKDGEWIDYDMEGNISSKQTYH
jgi:antitoxin component YwqK of YwqJK toxin-antitoxin module